MSDGYPGRIHRDPYPDLREKVYWAWVKHFTDREVPPKSWVQLSCPETGDVIATEHTEPVKINREASNENGIWTYDCRACGEHHSWIWGPPVPILAVDQEIEEDDD